MIRYMLAVLCVVTIFSSPVSAQSGPFSGDPFIRFHIAREAFSNNFNRFNVGFESLKPVKSFEFFWGPEEHVFAPSLLLEPRVSDIGSVSGLIDEEGVHIPRQAPPHTAHIFLLRLFLHQDMSPPEYLS